MENTIKFVLPEGTTEFTLREGDAPRVRVVDPKQYTFDGLLSAPGLYYEKRFAADAKYFDPAKSVVEVDYDKRTIRLLVDPKNPDADIVTGTIFSESQLAPFQINKGSMWKPRDLGVFLRRNRQYFEDKTTGQQLIAELMTLKVTTNGQIEVSNDDRGNKSNLFTQKAVTNIPVSFTLNMPILSGGPKRTFVVDIHLDINGSAVDISLESIDLSEKTMDAIISEMDAQVELFAKSGIPIVYK